MQERPRASVATQAAQRDRVVWRTMVALAIAGMVACWILLTPPGGGPDEASHLVRAGAVARGDLDGVEIGTSGLEGFDLPDSYVLPDVVCYAFKPTVPASCAADPVERGATVELATRADEYPIWGHLAPGIASRLPGPAPIWWARLGGAAVPVALVAWAVTALGRERPLATASVLVAATPMAWFTWGIVNPSALAIGGALALWVALIHRTVRHADWLAACGWAALALPRRDGLVWACLVLVVALVARDEGAARWWRTLRPGPRLVVVAATVATVVWGIVNDSRGTGLIVLAPLVVAGVEGLRWWWRTRATTGVTRAATLVASALATAAGVVVVLRARPGGWDPDLAERVVGETGNNLVEAIGVLGWLDTTLPTLVIAAWLVTLGVLAAVSVIDSPGPGRLAAAVTAVAIGSSWVFELYQGNVSGTYWQGRYSLPLLAGVPILLGTAAVRPAVAMRVARVAGIGALGVVEAAFLAAGRRFGVGTAGSLAPWDWDTYRAPVAPLVLAVAHLVFAATLAVLLFGRAGRQGAVIAGR